MPTDPVDTPGLNTELDPQPRLVSSPAPAPSMITAEAAAKALCETFLANADRGDNAANDHLVAEILGRIRTRWRDVDSTPHTRAMLDRTECGATARGLDVAP